MKIFPKTAILPFTISLVIGLLTAVLLTFLIYAPTIAKYTSDLYKIEQQLAVANQALEDADMNNNTEIEDLKLQLKLVEDGASIIEAKQIIEVSKEAGISPKL